MDIVLECPHCQIFFIVDKKDLNCMIFRHAVFKKNMEPINPHSPKKVCDDLVNKNLVIGCAKPIKIIQNNDTYEAIICDYI